MFSETSWVCGVTVVPSWVTEPQDASVVVGALLVLRCAAAGRPEPAIAWHRRQGEAEADGEAIIITSQVTTHLNTPCRCGHRLG